MKKVYFGEFDATQKDDWKSILIGLLTVASFFLIGLILGGQI